MTTWTEDFAHSLDSLGLAHPADLDPGAIASLIYSLGKAAQVSGAVTVGEIVAAGAVAEGLVAVAGISASFYVGALIGAGIYASAKQGWDFLTSGPGLREMYNLYQAEVPVINLPSPVEEVSTSYQYSAHEDPAPPLPFPGTDLYDGCADADSTRAVQERLVQLGYTPLTVDGYYGPKTAATVQWFQGNSELKVDGIVGPYTWAKLF
ncbi:MAG: peptidoglycan-binding domain-containing protein [Acidimicrobiales bacterium]